MKNLDVMKEYVTEAELNSYDARINNSGAEEKSSSETMKTVSGLKALQDKYPVVTLN